MEEITQVPHTRPTTEVMEQLSTNLDQGLSSDDVERRLESYGPNELREEGKQSTLGLFLDQWKDFLIIILLVSSIISAVFGELLDTIAIGIILVLNASLGFYQEYKAERSLEALQSLTSPKAHVVRDGVTQEMDAKNLVPGDILVLSAGDVVPADARVVESFSLQADESTLTGESTPVHKRANGGLAPETQLSERSNMLFLGTNVVKGNSKAVVTNTGMNTIIGNITTMLLTADDRETPLKIKLNAFGKKLGYAILAICGLVVVTGVVAEGSFEVQTFVHMLIVGVALAVAAIPEGLPAVVTVALSIGVLRMSKQRAIVRKLRAVETLGSTTVICADKTGTLTQNKMTTALIYTPSIKEGVNVRWSKDGEQVNFGHNGEEVSLDVQPNLQFLLQMTILVNNAKMSQKQAGKLKFIGDPTEQALLMLGVKSGLDHENLTKACPRLLELPFESERKMMSTIHRTEEGKFILLCKGAPDVVRTRCTSVRVGEDDLPMTQPRQDEYSKVEKKFSSKALRILGFAFKYVSEEYVEQLQREEELDYAKAERDLTYLGLVGMRDPPRPEAIRAIEVSRKAGIKVIMITGDHKNTAVAIAKDMGLLDDGEEKLVVTGQELDGLSDEALLDRVGHTKVFARVSPEHKIRIVRALQEKGEITAMTGDGVNDAPALKQADIGVAMGKGGTDVAKQASDMVLTDDNFATLEAAVEEGRNIYANMKKFIGYLLACNAGEVMTIFLGIIFVTILLSGDNSGITVEDLLPLTALQILYVNLITDGLPALALGVDPKDPYVMNYPPRDPNEGIFNHHMIGSILLAGTIVGIGTLVVFFYELGMGLSPSEWVVFDASEKVVGGTIFKAQTMAFTVLIIFQKVMAFSQRHESESLFKIGVFKNHYLVAAVLFSTALHFVIIYVPFFQDIFGTVGLSLVDWAVIVGMSLTVLVAEEVRKFTFRTIDRKKMENASPQPSQS